MRAAVGPWLVLASVAALLAAGPVFSQSLGEASVALSWQPAEPEPRLVLDMPLNVTYTTSMPSVAAQPTTIHVDVRSTESALNSTVAPADIALTPPPLGGAATGNVTLHLRWLFAPLNSRTGNLTLTAMAAANGGLPAASTTATMTVRFPQDASPPAPIPQAPPAATRPTAGFEGFAGSAALLGVVAAAVALARRRL